MGKNKALLKDALLRAIEQAKANVGYDDYANRLASIVQRAADESEEDPAFSNDAAVADADRPPQTNRFFYSNWGEYTGKNSSLVHLKNGKKVKQWELEEAVRRSMPNYSPLGDLPGGRNRNEPAVGVIASKLNMIDKTQAARQAILEKYPEKWPSMGNLEKLLKMPLSYNKKMLYNWTGGKAGDKGGLLHAKAGAGKTTAFNDYYPFLAAGHALTHKYLWWTAPAGTMLTADNLRKYPVKEKRYIVGAPVDIAGFDPDSLVGGPKALWDAIRDIVSSNNDYTVNFVFDEFFTLLNKASGGGTGEGGVQDLISFLKDAFGQTDDAKYKCRFFGLYATGDMEEMDRLLGSGQGGLGFYNGQMARRIGKGPMYEIPWSQAEGWAKSNLVGRSFKDKDLGVVSVDISSLEDEDAKTAAGTANLEIAKLMAQKAKAIFYRSELPDADMHPDQTSVQAAVVMLWSSVKEAFANRVLDPKYLRFVENESKIKNYEDTKDHMIKLIANLEEEISKLEALGSDAADVSGQASQVLADTDRDVLASISFREIVAMPTAGGKPLPPAGTKSTPAQPVVSQQPATAPISAPAPDKPAAPAVEQKPAAGDSMSVEKRMGGAVLQELKKRKLHLETTIEKLDDAITKMETDNIAIKRELRTMLEKPISEKIKNEVIKSDGDYSAKDLSDFRLIKKIDVIKADASKAQQAMAALEAQERAGRAGQGGPAGPKVRMQPGFVAE